MKRKPDHIKQEDWDAVESPPLSNKMLSRVQPVRKTHPNMPARVRGPQKKPTKKQLTIRLSPEVVEYFKFRTLDLLIRHSGSKSVNKSYYFI